MPALFSRLAEQDAPSSGVFDFPSLSLTDVRVLQVILSGVTVTTDGTRMRATFYIGGSEITGTSYRYAMELNPQDGAAGATDAGISQAAGYLHSATSAYQATNATSRSYNGILWVDEPLSTALHKRCRWRASFGSVDNSMVAGVGAFICENTGALEGIKIQGSSAFIGGHCRILGLS